MTKTKMDWKIWGKKLLLNSVAVLIVGGASVWADEPLFLIFLPVLKAVENYIKHI
jgi:hypothetical protein